MSSSARDQALVATFAFGAVVCASLGTVLFHLRGGALSLFRGDLRLVLAGFLLFASLWAVDGFVATFIDQTSASGCQIAVAFAAAFDQLARIVLEEFLFWAMKSDTRATCGVLFPQAVFFLRFIIGGVFVGVQRPQFDPVCVATNLLWPLGVAVLCTDAFIVLTLVTRASSVGVFRDMRVKGPVGSRSRGIALIMMALGLWIPLSVPMILGISSFGIATRTALPAVGVLLVIGVIAFYFKDVVLPLKAISQKTASFLNKFPGLSEAAPPPTREPRNQEASAVESSVPPDRFGRPREYSREVTTSATARALSSGDGNNQLPIISRPSPGQAAAGVGGMPVKGELFPPIRAGSLSTKREESLMQPTKKAVIKGGKLVISYPIVQEDKLSEASPLKRIATVDLATAARQDRERRVNPAAPQQLSTNRYSRQATKELQRKQIGRDSATGQTRTSTLEPIEERASASQAASSAVLSAPATPSGDVRQRSPKHISQCFQGTFPSVIPAKNASGSGSKSPTSRNSSSGVPVKPPPRSPLRPSPENTTSATALKGPDKPLAETLDRTADHVEEFKNSAAAPSSQQQTSQTPPSRSESVSRRKSIVSPGRTIDVLVPPVPPLSPRDVDSSSYYQLERKSSKQHRRSGPSSSIPRSGSVKNNIRPSRKRPQTPPPIDEVKSSKTPVQLRETTGLPSHPRARAAEASASKSQDPTVMFVNSIDYNDPSRVRDIIDEMATDLAAKADRGNSDDKVSVVHRPRPIPRKSPITPSGSAKESPTVGSTSDLLPMKKEGEARLKASILTATAGESPSQPPPPPPPPPKSKPLEPARTKTSVSLSKTFSPEVKAYITPVAQTGITPPPTILQTQASHDRARPEKNVNDRAAVAKVTPQEYDEPSPSGKRKEDATRYLSKFSIATTMSPEDPPSAYLQSPAFKLLRSSQEGLRRRSSPVLPVNDARESITPTSIVIDQPGVQSTTPSYAKQYIKEQDLEAGYVSKSLGADLVAPGMPARVSYADSALPNDEDDGREMVTFMLDRNTYYPANATSTPSPQNSMYGSTEGKKGSWHCRVGENPPTFSNRESMQSRRFPKPPPLELHKIFKRIKGSPPQPPPLDTAKQAIDEIQEQLKKFEDSNMDAAELEKRRMSLLKDIEMEMGMEENRWQKMRDDLTRASVLTVGSHPGSPLPHVASSLASQNMQSPAMNVAESSPKNNGPYLSGWEKDTGRPRSSVLYTADQVQMSRPRRVPDRFQVTTANNTSEISERVAREGVSITTGNTSPVAPSSPSNNETYSRLGNSNREQRSNQKEEVAPAKGVLWKSDNITQTPEITKSQIALWNSASDSAIQSTRSLSPGPRPETRKPREISPVEESGLWDNPPESFIPQAKSPSLWRATPQSPKSPPSSQEPATRPRTLRPPRKSKRISSLPDILENPEPLKNNRDALGIFRFPWGETSDAATLYTPFQNQMFVLPGNMGAGVPPIYPTLELQMQILRSQQQPSSYFEHYDDEEEAVENISEDSDNDSFYDDDEYEDDSFEERTLWEIASLLKSDRVPSRESLFPNNSNTLPGSLKTLETTVPVRPSSVPAARQPAEEEEPEHIESEPSPVPLLRRQSSSPTLPPPEVSLWVNNVHMPPSTVNQGLFQDGKLWDTYVEIYKSTARAPPRQTKASDITSTSLWSQPAINAGSPPIGYLWSGESKSQSTVEATVEITEISCPNTPEPEFLWSIPEPTLDEDVFGLPRPKSEHWDHYNDLGEVILRSRPRKGGHLNIESQSLWTQGTPQEEQTNKKLWLEGITPASPSDGTNEGDTSLATDITLSIETRINSQESEEGAISIEEQPTYDTGIIIGPHDDIVISNPRGNDLWVPISILPLDEEEHQGLFKIQQGSYQHDKGYRRSSKSPAALETRPTPRSSRQPLQKLESHALWAPATPQTFAQDWVTLSSVRPSTPPGQLSYESGSESPVSDISSVYSNVTGESTVASFLTGQASVQLKPHLVTDADWMATPKGTTGPATRPRNEIARSVPSWAAALHDSPEGAAQPPTASASQPEQEALQSTNEETQPAVAQVDAGEEISAPEKQPNPLSYRRETQIGGFDPARHHPVFNVYILDTSNGDYHPAAEGYIHTLVNKNPDLIQR
ncbi:hypothetical protein MANI_018519 [Metarhizium anisopliae]